MKQSERIEIFVEEIWKWFSRHKRELPWRDLKIQDDTERAYQILVSEIMLQQTQVSRVKIVFKEFLSKFSKLSDLASATNSDVIQAWRGMGYNNRALRLRDAAREVDSGKWKEDTALFPKKMEHLMQLPGVGHYTAGAIRNFAFNIPTPCIDTNIRRILHRVFFGPENTDGTWVKNDKELLSLAEKILDFALNTKLSIIHYPLSTSEWHAALMDFGSLVCTARNPKWELCPLTKAGIMKAAHRVPVVIKKTKKEPGRMVGSTYIPNRIFRGKVIEYLRDANSDATLESIGKEICIDWNEDLHTVWLEGILKSLQKDHLIAMSEDSSFMLKD